jgi:hypothetical protein
MGVYRERVGWPAWVHLVLLLPCGVGLAAMGWAAAKGEEPGWAYVPFLVLASVGLVWWRMRYLALEFGPAGAAFGFAGLRRRVPRERIVSATAEEYSVARYMGWGYRFGWERGERAYSLIGYPRGVRLVFDDERGRRWRIFLSCSDPEAAIQALQA